MTPALCVYDSKVFNRMLCGIADVLLSQGKVLAAMTFANTDLRVV
jgi:hypothetical protein